MRVYLYWKEFRFFFICGKERTRVDIVYVGISGGGQLMLRLGRDRITKSILFSAINGWRRKTYRMNDHGEQSHVIVEKNIVENFGPHHSSRRFY